MNLLQAFVLGVVEGLTEFLPVSSTGHLILVGRWLGVDAGARKTAADAFEVVVQLGALFAVVVHFRALLATRIAGLFRRDPAAVALAVALAIAFVPAVVIGYALHKTIEARLFGPVPVAAALIAGGVGMIAVEWWRARRARETRDGLDQVTPRRALAIGLGQCLSLWPGTSRSMTTIVTGQLTGLSTATAAEFSFLLALPTLGAATLFKLVKARHELLGPAIGGAALAVGLAAAFVTAWAVIAAFLRYLRTWGLAPFGFYRIALGVTVLLLTWPRG
jgi:undecaprenyl-diphosphatase